MYCPVCHSEYPADWKACPRDATGLLKSAQIGKYRIEGMLGIGGMGAVYKATNPDIKGSRVAIKVMNPSVAGAEQTRERFKREAAAVAALRTSHVVKVYDFDTESDGSLYLVMELLDGHALRDEILPAPQYMDLARVQMVMEGALKGLAAAHKVGIVHRDLKPENIYVADTDDGEVPKLLDFGIARVRSQDKHLTHTGSLMGTASYMAQEQIAAGVAEIGPWSDVYAMGAILYEMLAGAPAFGGNTVTEVLQRVLKAESVPLSAVRPGLSPEVYALVARCMSNVPATRPQDAEAMRIALNAARIVPIGAVIPPPHNTRVDQAQPSQISSGGGSAPGQFGVMATEGYHTPLPNLTPPGLAGTAIGPGVGYTPPTGNVSGSSPGNVQPAIGTGTGTNPHNPLGSSAFGPTVGVSSNAASTATPATGHAAPAKPKSKLPLVIGGVAVVAIGAVIAFKVMGSSEPTKTTVDAGLVAQVDAAPVAIDTAVAAIDAAPVDKLPAFTAAMAHFAAGTYRLGEAPKPSPNALDLKDYDVGEFWIDKEEVTLAALRSALKSPKIGGAPGDTPTTPARNVSWKDASAACAALGKRLPTDLEWEVASASTPNTKEIAALKVHAQAKLLVPNHDGCTTKKCDCSEAGLCDMLGGVLEWTADGPDKKLVRGSGHTVQPTEGWMATTHFRQLVDPVADAEVGFRCMWDKSLPTTGGGHGDPLKPDAPKTGDAPKPSDPKPGVVTPKPSAGGKCDDVDGLYRTARDAFVNGQYAVAISKAEQGIACAPEDRGYMTVAMAACKLKNAPKAKAALANVTPGGGKRLAVKQVCDEAGVELEGAGRVKKK